MMLLVMGVTGAWGVDISCSVDFSSITSSSGTETGTNCSAYYNKFSDISKSSNYTTVNSNRYYKLSSNDGYITVTYTGENATGFMAGDVLTMSLSTKAESSTAVGYYLHRRDGNYKTEDVATGSAVDVTYTLKAADIESDGKIKIYRYDSNTYMFSISVTGVRNTEAFTVTFDTGTNGTCGTTSLTEASANAGVTLPAVTPNSGYAFNGWYTAATEGTKVGDANDSYRPTANITLHAQYSACSDPTISIESSAAGAVAKNSTVTLTAIVDGAPTPTVQWYSNTENNSTTGTFIDGATELTYSPSTASAGTMYYYAIATNNYSDADHTATSNVVSVVVNPSTACELTNIKFSNGAYGAINSATYGNKTIAVPYMVGTAAPTVVGSSVVVSADATYAINGNKLIVTAEDGTTNKEFTITTVAMTPLVVNGDVATTNFSAVPSWVFNLYGYDSSKGLKFAKAVNDGTMRIALGNTRQYYFIGAAKSLTLTKKGDTRKVNVYVNGTKVISDTNNDALGAIALDESAPCMVMIESNQTNGDGGFASYAISGSTSVSGTINAAGWNTYSSNYALDLSTITNGTAYVATATDGGNVTMTPVEDKIVAAGTGLMIKGTTGDKFTINTTANAATYSGDNLLVGLPNGGTVAVAGEGYNYVFGWTDAADPGFYLVETDTPTLGANKAYLHTATALSKMSIIINDTQETDGINAVVNNTENGVRYNLAGQKVGNDYKGVVIVNGKKYVRK